MTEEKKVEEGTVQDTGRYTNKTVKKDSYGDLHWDKGLKFKQIGKDILGVLTTLVIALPLIFGSWGINSEYQASNITLLGKIDRTVGAGFYWKIPYVETAHTGDTSIDEFTYETFSSTNDNQTVSFDLTIQHRINPANVEVLLPELFKKFGSSYNYEGRYLEKASLSQAKGVFGTYKVEDIMPNREQIRQKIANLIKTEAAVHGILIVDVQLSDIGFDKAYKTNLQQVAKKRAEAAAAYQDERKATFVANKEIEAAKGKAQSVILAADAKAHQIKVESIEKAAAVEREGKAQAEAIKAQNKAAANAKGLAELRRAEAQGNWDGSVPQFMSGGTGQGGSIFPFMNVKDMVGKAK